MYTEFKILVKLIPVLIVLVGKTLPPTFPPGGRLVVPADYQAHRGEAGGVFAAVPSGLLSLSLDC